MGLHIVAGMREVQQHVPGGWPPSCIFGSARGGAIPGDHCTCKPCRGCKLGHDQGRVEDLECGLELGELELQAGRLLLCFTIKVLLVLLVMRSPLGLRPDVAWCKLLKQMNLVVHSEPIRFLAV